MQLTNARFLKRVCTYVFLLPLSINGTAYSKDGAWKPEKTVEIVVGSSPGGGTDITARLLQKILQDLNLVSSVVVINKPGGGQTVAWSYLNQSPGDAHRISIVNEPLITNKIMGTSNLNYKDFTPLSVLYNEFIVFSVKPDSLFKTATGLVAQLKHDIGAVIFGEGSSRGNNAHIAISLLVKAIGGDPKRQKMVVFRSGGETQTALMGGHIDVGVSTIAAAAQHIRANRVRPLAVTSPERLGGDMADIPTWKENDIDVEYASWRVVFGPRGLTSAQIAFWEDVFLKATQTEAWKKALARNRQVDAYRSAAKTSKFLDTEVARLTPLFVDIGLAK